MHQILYSLIKKFIREYKCYTDSPKIDENSLDVLALAQHHSLPTPLLDWTYNPLIALFFALRKVYVKNHPYDPTIYVLKSGIPVISENTTLTEYFENKFNYISFDKERDEKVERIENFQETREDGNEKGYYFKFIPKLITERIIVQQGAFTIHTYPFCKIAQNDIVDKYTIRKDACLNIAYQIHKLGFNEKAMFPDLDGFCKNLSQEYFGRFNFNYLRKH